MNKTIMRRPEIKVTVVTPSFNQGEYLEETIDSVLSQNIKNLEYIIMDGGSVDQSVEIIKKHEKFLAYWQSKPDGGQPQAINEGFKRSSGDILCWLNSDDLYLPKTLQKVVDFFSQEKGAEFLYGDYFLLYPDGHIVAKPKISYDFDICLTSFLMIPQPSSFWTRKIYEAVGGINATYQYAFDYDFFLRIGNHLRLRPESLCHRHDFFSLFRVHNESKSVAQRKNFRAEHRQIRSQFGFSEKSFIKKSRQYYNMMRVLYRFHKERGFVPTRKEGGKA